MQVKVFSAQDPAREILTKQAEEAALLPGQLEHEIDWLFETDHGQKVTGGVLGLFDADRLAGYVPYRYRTDGLLFRMASVRLGRMPYRTVELFGPGVVARDEDVVSEALAQIDAVSEPFHALLLNEVPTDSALWKAVSARTARGFQTIERERGTHHLVDLPRSIDEYRARFSAKTRSTWTRKTRKLESEHGPLSLKVYARPEEVVDLLNTVDPVSKLTYHYHLLGRELSPRNTRLMANLQRWASRGWLRSYVLFAGERAVAYAIGSVARRRYSYDLPGYDPALSSSSPGILLLLRMIEELIESNTADVLDFGGGHADYKALLATRSFSATNALLVRRHPYAQGIAHLQRGMVASTHKVAQLMERYQMKSRMKNWIRGLKLRNA
jgi:CelD/BcsL family acetyltransferase involved in cellulose biosynthesis